MRGRLAREDLVGPVARLLGVLVGIGLSLVAMLLLGYDVAGFAEAVVMSLGSDTTLRWLGPLLLTGVAGAIAFRDGAFNLGLDGQIYLGGAASAAVTLTLQSSVPPWLVLLLATAAGIVGGACGASIPAILRLRWGVPELISTLVLNPVCLLFVSFLVQGGPLASGASQGHTESSPVFDRAVWLPALWPGSLASISVALAVALWIVVALYYRYTVWGFESKLYGAAPRFSFYAGVANSTVFVRAMIASGAVAGLVGSFEVLGVQHRLAKGFNPGLGFDGVAVALVAGSSIVGVGLVAALFAVLRNAGELSQINLGIPPELVNVLFAIVVLATSVQIARRVDWGRWRRPGSGDQEVAVVPVGAAGGSGGSDAR